MSRAGTGQPEEAVRDAIVIVSRAVTVVAFEPPTSDRPQTVERRFDAVTQQFCSRDVAMLTRPLADRDGSSHGEGLLNTRYSIGDNVEPMRS